MRLGLRRKYFLKFLSAKFVHVDVGYEVFYQQLQSNC